MVVSNTFELDARLRQAALLREAEVMRTVRNANAAVVKVAGPPKVQSEFFLRRFGHLIGRTKLQQA